MEFVHPYRIDDWILQRFDGAGNDFFVMALDHEPGAEFVALAQRACDRSGEFGGADGLLVVYPSLKPTANALMRIFNADGSIPEMCGNGVRCAAIFWLLDQARRENRMVVPAGARVTFDTPAGLIHCQLLGDLPTSPQALRGGEFRVRLNMGEPHLRWQDLGFVPQPGESRGALDSAMQPLELNLGGTVFRFYGVSMGNPHIVTFVDDVSKIDVPKIGRMAEHDPHFAHGTNVHFVTQNDRQRLHVRHWERGSGETQACGTGAVACAVTAIVLDRCNSVVRVQVPGGDLVVEWTGEEAWLEGPVRLHG